MRGVKPHISKSPVDRLIKLIFPVNCEICKKEEDWLCLECLKKLSVTPDNICRICRKSGRDGICERCRKELKLDAIISPFSYSQDAIKSLIKQGKFLGYSDVFVFLSRLIRSYVISRIRDEEAAVGYIPISPQRRKERGFDQSRIIAKTLFSSEETIHNLVIKIKDTPPQAQNELKDRRSSVSGAYQAVGRLAPIVILCDDVVTTGSTAREVSKTVRRAGARRVVLVTLAHS